MLNFRKLSAGAYVVALMLIFIPLFDISLQLAPWHPGISQWRFGFLGLVCNALILPVSGGLIAAGTAVLAEQERGRKWVGRLCWLVAILCALMIMVFALDAVQAAPKIVPTQMLSYRVSVMTATVKWFLGALAFALLGMGCGVPAPRAPKAVPTNR